MKTVEINNANIIEQIRSTVPEATTDKKGLLSASSVRFTRSTGLGFTEKGGYIKLYSLKGQSTVTAFVTTNRVEAANAGVYLLTCSMATGGTLYYSITKLNNGISASFYYKKDGNAVDIYMKTLVDYSINNTTPLCESGGYTYHLIKGNLPEGAVEITVS